MTDTQYTPPKIHGQASCLSFAVMFLVGILLFAIISLAIYSNDFLWFWPSFKEQPQQITLHCYGELVEFSPGSQEFVAIADLVNSQLSGSKRWDELPLSAETYEYYQTDPKLMILDIHFGRPVSVHYPSPLFKNINRMILPLDGRHAQTNAVFGLLNDLPTGGSIHVETNQPVIDYLRQAQICIKPSSN